MTHDELVKEFGDYILMSNDPDFTDQEYRSIYSEVLEDEIRKKERDADKGLLDSDKVLEEATKATEKWLEETDNGVKELLEKYDITKEELDKADRLAFNEAYKYYQELLESNQVAPEDMQAIINDYQAKFLYMWLEYRKAILDSLLEDI